MSDETARPGPVDLSREPDFHIGMLEVRPSTREVIRGSQREILEPKAMQVLVVLQQAAGRVVSRDDLIARCWEGRIVGEDAINRVIWRLRRFSEADGGADLTIETIPKVGYRLPPPPEKKAPAAAPQTVPEPVVPGALPGTEHTAPPAVYDNAPEPAPSNLLYRHWLAAGAAALLVAAALALAAWLLLPVRPVETSVAVLPFVNLSGDPKQEFFSDGITEEITSALAKVPGLTVIGRTSAFQFKGENKDMRAIGYALGAKNLIEGSVRKAGDQVRITVQLIKATDGTDLWTESYDRKLTDIFAVQEDIATAIAGALQVPLGLSRGQDLISSRTRDLDAYQQFLYARALYRARKVDDAISTLKRVVARDPSYAPAWALLAFSLTLPGNLTDVEKEIRAGDMDKARVLTRSKFDGAEKAARDAIRLDPRLAMGYAALAPVEGSRGNWIGSEDDYRQALALDPNDPDVLFSYASFLADVGRLKDARRVQTQILGQEPFVPNYNRQAADVLWAMGQNDVAMKILESMNSNQARNLVLAKVYATVGRFGQAADTLRAIPASDQYSRQTLDDAARLIQFAPGMTGAPNALPVFGGPLNFVNLFVGADDRFLEAAERRLQVGLNGGLFRDPWAPPSAPLRKTEHFKTFARQTGFVAYWRARGWPEFCHPVGANDFACQ